MPVQIPYRLLLLHHPSTLSYSCQTQIKASAICALFNNLKIIKKLLVDEKPSSFIDCVKLARNKFEDLFNYNIKALITKYPKDHKTDNGCEFWGGSYRFPSSIEYDATNELYANFIKATAKLYAVMYKIKIPQDQLENAANLALNVDVNEYKPEEYSIEEFVSYFIVCLHDEMKKKSEV